MDTEYEIYEKIDNYLKGKLSSPQQADFEEQLQVDPLLVQQVKTQKLANEIVFAKGLADLKARMSADISSGRADSKPKGIWAWVIGLVMVAMVASWVLFGNRPQVVSVDKMPVNLEGEITNLSKQAAPKELPSVSSISQSIPAIGKEPDKVVEAGAAASLTSKIETQQQSTIYTPIVEQPKFELKSEASIPVEKSKVDCGVKQWHFTLQASPTCTQSNDGVISVIDKDNQLYALGNGNFSTSKSFHHLKNGVYSIAVKDDNGCITTSEVEVYSKNCQEILEVAINPLIESWHIPIKESKRGELQIFSKSGKLAFSKQWEQGEEFDWDGKNQSGDLLGRGLYSFIIQYANGDTQQGTISITY